MRRCALQYNHETRRASRLPVLLLLLCCVIASVKGDINEEARFLKSVVTTGCWDDLTNCNIFVDIFQNICSSPSCRPLIVPFSFNDIGWIFKFSDAADDKLNPKKQNDVKKHDISKHHLSKRKVSKRVVTIYIGKDKRTTVIDFDGSATSSIYDIADILDFVTKLNKLSFLVKTLDVQGANDNNVELLGREFVDEMVDDLPDSCSTDLPACDIFTEKLSSFTAKNRLTPLVNVPSDVITTSSKYSFRRLSSHNGSSVNVLAFKQVYDGGFLLHQRNFGTTNETDLLVAYKVTDKLAVRFISELLEATPLFKGSHFTAVRVGDRLQQKLQMTTQTGLPYSNGSSTSQRSLPRFWATGRRRSSKIHPMTPPQTSSA